MNKFKIFQSSKMKGRGFTLLELMIVTVIIILLASIGGWSYRALLLKARRVACQSNLRAINAALQMYFHDYGILPVDVPPEGVNLIKSLAPYKVSPEVFHCPSDPDTGNTYEVFYVYRDSYSDKEAYLIGCPYHSRGEKTNNLLFGYEDPQELTILKVEYNGNEVNFGEKFDWEIGDQITFEDQTGGTYAVVDVIDNISEAMVIQSFSLEDGTPYGIIKVDGDGKVDCDVTSGSRFEVVTPAAIAGVQGTRFTVRLDYDEDTNLHTTYVEVQEGEVLVSALPGATLEVEGTSVPATIVSQGNLVNVTREAVPVVGRIEIKPKKVKKLGVGESYQFTLEAWDEDGDPLPVNTNEIVWEVKPIFWANGTTDDNGVYTATQRGIDRIKATYRNYTDHAIVIVKRKKHHDEDNGDDHNGHD